MKHSTTERTVNNEDARASNQFWKLGLDKVRMMFSKGMLTVTGYIYAILKCSRKDGWWMSLSPKEFMIEFNIKRTAFYDAIALLAADKDLDFEWSAKQMRVRFKPKDEINEIIEKTSESIDNSLGHSQQGELVRNSGQFSEISDSCPEKRTVFRNSGQTTPEIYTQTELHDSTDSFRFKHINLSDTREIETSISSEEEEVIQNPHTGQNQEELVHDYQTPLESKITPPCENDSQNLEFDAAPVNEPEFLAYYKSYRKEQGTEIKNPARYVASCLNKGDEGAIEIESIFGEWKGHCSTLQRKISSYAENPELQKRYNFDSWDVATHEAYLYRLQARGINKFCEDELDARWYNWASAKHPSKFANIPD